MSHKAMAKDLKCCSIALLVFSILSLTDLFVLIPGCVTASQFVCEDVALMSIATLKDKARMGHHALSAARRQRSC